MSGLPAGWELVPLSGLGSEVRGNVAALPEVLYQLWSVPSFSWGTPELVDGSEIGSAKRPVEPGDVLICKINPRINRVWVVGDAPIDRVQVASPEWLTFRVADHDRVLPEYLRWYLSSPQFRDWISLSAVGATGSHTRAKSGPMLEQPVPLAPLEEQRRIVAILEGHLSRLDAAEELMARSVTSASTLAQVLVEKVVANAGQPQPLQALTINSGYGTSEKCVAGGPGVAVVRIPNLVSGEIDLTEEKRLHNPAADVSRLLLHPGDLLVIRTNGSRELIGRAAVVQDGVRAAFASYLIRFQLDRRLVHPEWVRMVLSAPSCRRTLESLAASSAGQYNLSLSKLGGVPIPVPPLDRQRELLTLLNQPLDGIARWREQSSALAGRGKVLRQSLLAAAFAGRLAG